MRSPTLAGPASEPADVFSKPLAAVEDDATSLIEFVEAFGSQRAERRQLLPLLAALLLQQAETGPHHLADVFELPRGDLFFDEAVIMVGEIDVPRGHGESSLDSAALLQVYPNGKNCQLRTFPGRKRLKGALVEGRAAILGSSERWEVGASQRPDPQLLRKCRNAN